MATLRGRSYLYLKILKAHVPGLRGVRLLKKAAPVREFDGRPILSSAEGNTLLFERLRSGEPMAAGKIGDTELEVLVQYQRFQGDPDAFFDAISRGHELELLYLNCGVFPRRQDVLVGWAETYLDGIRALDVLAVWHNAGEKEVAAEYAAEATLVEMRSLEPYYHDEPWSSVLEGRRIVVVTPFADSIAQQHRDARGADLFPGSPSVLPPFELALVRAPFSAGLVPPTHSDWHSALDDLKERVAASTFDVCLVGAGAWSLPLCAFVRNELRRPGIHLGGALQILFGVRGRRWETHPVIGRFFNEHWIRPLPHEVPKRQWMNDGGAYW